MRREKDSIISPSSGPPQLASLPFDSPEKSRASLIVESDDDTGGGKLGVVIHRGTPTQRRAENPSQKTIRLLKGATEPYIELGLAAAGLCIHISSKQHVARQPNNSTGFGSSALIGYLLLWAARRGRYTWRWTREPATNSFLFSRGSFPMITKMHWNYCTNEILISDYSVSPLAFVNNGCRVCTFWL